MANLDSVIKQARECHTKQAWETLFRENGEGLAATNNSKPLQEIFKHLRADPQSLQYDPSIWGQLIRGCLSAWNLELGREVAEFAKQIPSAAITIPAAQLYLESGFPSLARETANRGLRLSGLSAVDKLRLEMAVCSSYAEEGKRAKTIRLLNKIRAAVQSSDLGDQERADFLMSMGRMQFLLGRYLQAADLFYEASTAYRNLESWEAAAKAIFNTAACHLNGGSPRGKDEAFAMIEECRRLAEDQDLAGPLSHCESAYGMDAYQLGNFAAAREHLRRALEHLPVSDKSYRRLHILSMLAYTYMGMGRYHLAHKFGQQTLDLAALDESERFKTRYSTLHAELLWEEGKIEESHDLLKQSVTPFENRGVHTLEELTTLNRYRLQLARFGTREISTRYSVDENLRKNHYAWLDHQHTEAQVLLNAGQRDEADELFESCRKQSRDIGDRYHEAVALLGLMQNQLSARNPHGIDAYFRDFEVLVGRIGETPLRTQIPILRAARAYQLGDFDGGSRHLRQAAKSKRQSFVDRFVLTAWTATLEGRSPRLTAPWKKQLVARATKLYFAPTLEAIDKRHFRVSDLYVVSLERHPSLAELLHYLLLKSHFTATMAEIQTEVWNQSLEAQGWQQKIRNTIMRLRDFFPYTIAPLIVHSDSIALYSDAIDIQPQMSDGLRKEEEVVRLLRDTPMSSAQLSQRLKISPSTTKRILKQLSSNAEIHPIRKGRRIFYAAPESRPPGN